MIEWIKRDLMPRRVTSDEALYEKMESQSGYSLAIIYQPFDVHSRAHWSDHGLCLDFLEVAGGGDLLDIGPGDGWPSLPVAFHARSVTGLDASPRRIAVCEANAWRLGLHNFRGVTYRAGERWPLENESFDGAMAASSLENSPNPQELLREIRRVLKPGGSCASSMNHLPGTQTARSRRSISGRWTNRRPTCTWPTGARPRSRWITTACWWRRQSTRPGPCLTIPAGSGPWSGMP